MNPENELMACPFCNDTSIEQTNDLGPHCYFCNGCGVMVCGSSDENARKVWNTRAVPVTPEELARLVEIAEDCAEDCLNDAHDEKEKYHGMSKYAARYKYAQEQLEYIQQIKSRLDEPNPQSEEDQ